MHTSETSSVLGTRWSWAAPIILALPSFAVWPAADAAGSGPPLQSVTREGLCVTNGVVSALPGGRLTVDSASSRAVARVSDGAAAEVRFRYVGPSTESKPLASGEMRRQIGIKLRARDTCNLVYVMWHIEPDAKVAVSVKRNPGKHTHAECGANGYTALRPERRVDLPRINPGEAHTLRATLQGDHLDVFADERLAWTGSLGNAVVDFNGPTGFRTDNARFEFNYSTTSGTATGKARAVDAALNHCVAGPGD
jgi:hypothetical protein